MQSVPPYSHSFGATKVASAKAVHAPRFGEGPIKAAEDFIDKGVEVAAPKPPGFARRMAVPAAWVAGGALLAFGTAGILHFIGFPLIAWGAYKAVQRWKG